jgi:hypothetical protein
MRLDELGHAMALPSSESICQSITRKVEERGPDDNYTAVAVRVLDGGGDATMPAPSRQSASTVSAASGSTASRVSENAPRNLFNPPAETDLNGPRRPSRSGGIAALLIALLALGLAAYAAWAASQSRGGDPVLAAQVDSLRNEVATLRARAAMGDSVGVRTDSVPLAGARPAAPGAVVPPPAGAPPAGTTTTGRTTTPATPSKQP